MIGAHEPLHETDPEVWELSLRVGIVDMLESIEEFGEHDA